MNRHNLTRLRQFGVLAEITHTAQGHPVLAINFPAHKEYLGFAGAPTGDFELDEFSAATANLTDAKLREFKEKDESVQITQAVIMALTRQGEAVAKANADSTIAPAGVLKIAVAALETSLTTMGRQFAKLTLIEADLQRQYEQCYAVPRPDNVEVVEDVEIRGEFRRLTEQEQKLRVSKLPDEPRLLIALMRNPLPVTGFVAETVRDTWVNQIALARPEKAATLQLSQDCNDWALRFTKHLATYATSSSISGTNGAVDRFACYRILKPTGGLALLEFADHEIAMHERRLQQAAA